MVTLFGEGEGGRRGEGGEICVLRDFSCFEEPSKVSQVKRQQLQNCNDAVKLASQEPLRMKP